MVDVQAEDELQPQNGHEVNEMKSNKKRLRNRKKPLAIASSAELKNGGRQLSSHGSSDDIEGDSVISVASNQKIVHVFPVGNLLVNNQMAYGLALMMGLEASVRTINGTVWSGLVHSFGPGEVVLCQVTELSLHIVSTKPDDEFPLMDFVCIAMNDVVELLVKDVANDGSIKDLEARVIPPITASSKERRKSTNQSSKVKKEEEVRVIPESHLNIQEEKEDVPNERSILEKRSPSDSFNEDPKVPAPRYSQKDAVKQEPFRSSVKDTVGISREERHSDIPPRQTSRDFNLRNVPQNRQPPQHQPQQQRPPSHFFASKKTPFSHNTDRNVSHRFPSGPKFPPRGSNGNFNWNQKANYASQQQLPAQPPTATERFASLEKKAVRPMEKSIGKAEQVNNGTSKMGLTDCAKEEEKEKEKTWDDPGHKVQESSIKANPWSGTSNVWHRRHLSTSDPHTTQNDLVEDKGASSLRTYNREDSDNQRFVDSFRQAATRLNPEALEFVPRAGSVMEEAVMETGKSAALPLNAEAGPFSPMTRVTTVPVIMHPLSPTAGPFFPMEPFLHPSSNHALPPHVLPVPNMFVPLDVQPFFNAPGGFPAAPAPFFHSIAPNGEAQGIYMPILPPLESYYASLLFHQMQAAHFHQQQQQLGPQPSFPMQQPVRQEEGQAGQPESQQVPSSEQQLDEGRPSSYSSASSSSNETLSRVTSSVSFGQLSSTTSELTSS